MRNKLPATLRIGFCFFFTAVYAMPRFMYTGIKYGGMQYIGGVYTDTYLFTETEHSRLSAYSPRSSRTLYMPLEVFDSAATNGVTAGGTNMTIDPFIQTLTAECRLHTSRPFSPFIESSAWYAHSRQSSYAVYQFYDSLLKDYFFSVAEMLRNTEHTSWGFTIGSGMYAEARPVGVLDIKPYCRLTGGAGRLMYFQNNDTLFFTIYLDTQDRLTKTWTNESISWEEAASEEISRNVRLPDIWYPYARADLGFSFYLTEKLRGDIHYAFGWEYRSYPYIERRSILKTADYKAAKNEPDALYIEKEYPPQYTVLPGNSTHLFSHQWGIAFSIPF